MKLKVLAVLVALSGIAQAQNVSAPNLLTSTLTAAKTNATTSYVSIFTLSSVPISTTMHGECQLIWETSSTSGTVTIALTPSVAPTGLWVESAALTTATAVKYTAITTATQTAVTAALTASAATTGYSIHLSFVIQNATAGANAITVAFVSSSASYTQTIEPGSSCSLRL